MRNVTPPRRMQGAALVVAMIMLLLIAIIGFGAMQTTTMEEKMSGNLRDDNLAFQAAEAGLRDREEWLRTRVTPPAPNGNWLFDDNYDWNAPLAYGTDSGNVLTGVNAQPELVVQEFEFVPDELVVGFEVRKGRDLYLVLSRGTGQTPNARTTLESTAAKRFN